MKKLKSKFTVLLGLLFIAVTVKAQITQSKSNNCLAANSLNSATEVTSTSGLDEMQNLKAEMSQLKAEVKALKEVSNNNATNKISFLKNIKLNNNAQQQKASIQILLPDYAIDGYLYITDKYGRLVFNQNIRDGVSYNINYATWFSGDYSVELFTDGELVEATTMNIKK